jgi:hypothetical protein
MLAPFTPPGRAARDSTWASTELGDDAALVRLAGDALHARLATAVASVRVVASALPSL